MRLTYGADIRLALRDRRDSTGYDSAVANSRISTSEAMLGGNGDRIDLFDGCCLT